MQRQSQCAERDDGQDRESTLYPKQFAIEWHQLLQVRFPIQPVWHLKAGDQNYEMRRANQPQVIVKESLCDRIGHSAWMARMNGIITRCTNQG